MEQLKFVGQIFARCDGSKCDSEDIGSGLHETASHLGFGEVFGAKGMRGRRGLQRMRCGDRPTFFAGVFGLARAEHEDTEFASTRASIVQTVDTQVARLR
jgi:hypothetical protein